VRLFHQAIASADDVFALRQRGRQVSALAGFDAADQVRLATALSELGRDVMATRHGGAVDFALDVDRSELVVTCTGLPGPTEGASPGLGAARRLLPGIEVVGAAEADLADAVEIRLGLPLPVTAAESGALRSAIERLVVISPLDELRSQNRELIAALEELSVRHGELTALNAELDQTNQGVMAMFTQLSEELETTNRGVVALYAELDEKTQRLQETTDAKSRFLNSVSHELRSPVSSIVGLSRLLLDPAGGSLDGEQQRQVELVAATAEELLDLVNQLLDLARAEFGHLEPEVSRVELVELAARVVDVLRPLARDGVEVAVATSEGRVDVLTDPTLARQVVRNLVANALAFTTAGSVTVRIERPSPDAVAVAVADTGIGIAAADLPKIFEEFFQVRGPHQTSRRGSGLGLAYSRRVVELLGGELDVDSEVGRGSTFTMRLPVADAAPATSPSRPLAVGRVLVADDDPTFRASVRAMLQAVASQVEEAADGVQALARLRDDRFDLVLLDLMMPQLDGAGVLAAMAADPDLRDVPVVVVTSADPSRTRLPGALAVVAKQGLTAAILLTSIAPHL
jgi:signal transduction histidine kinase/CheY-like chemotaxis protein